MYILYFTLDLPGKILNLNDLGLLLEELLDVRGNWYHFGLQLKVKTETLDSIRQRFSDRTLRLLEVLKVWLTTAVNPSWKTLTDALRNAHASQLADDLDMKYCSMKDMKESKHALALAVSKNKDGWGVGGGGGGVNLLHYHLIAAWLVYGWCV